MLRTADIMGGGGISESFPRFLSSHHRRLLPSAVHELGALKHIDKADSNQAASVISILQERLTFFRYLREAVESKIG